jgi:hypothetical protein
LWICMRVGRLRGVLLVVVGRIFRWWLRGLWKRFNETIKRDVCLRGTLVCI